MKTLLLHIFNGRILSPWWVLSIDLLLTANAFVLAYVLRLNFSLADYSVWQMLRAGGWILFVYLAAFLGTGSYRGVIRLTNYNELKKLLLSAILALFVLIGVDSLTVIYEIEWIDVPRLALIMHFFFSISLCFGFRMMVREIYSFLTHKRGSVRTFIYGTGDLGIITFDAINSDNENQYHVVGFIDDDSSRWNVNFQSLPVYSWEKAMEINRVKHIEVIILTQPNLSVQKKQVISEACTMMNWKLKVMPTVGNWVNGISNRNQIRDIRIEDLLGRDEIHLNQRRITEGLESKTILVTGAAGSIGSEIVRQLLRFPVRKVLLLDVAESGLYNLQQELLLSYSDAPFEVVIGDVTNLTRLRMVFDTFKPQLVFNAAAYKHVPLMEAFPYEAIRVNIGGVKNLADLSIEFDIEKFVMISTDKAVNPTNVMGASKRICEMYIQSLAQLKNVHSTRFITTRFGNVLGSNGSVVPLFKRQIEQGGPVTVTHPDITRFFMTIPEACQLVLEAGFMGKGGEIYVFDMGEPVKIDDLARSMIRLAGLKVGEDINIKYTGLRPGEKLYEELLASKETTLPTYHEKIKIGKVRLQDYHQINKNISDLLTSIQYESEVKLVARMKDIVPEYISQNSHFSTLDTVPN